MKITTAIVLGGKAHAFLKSMPAFGQTNRKWTTLTTKLPGDPIDFDVTPSAVAQAIAFGSAAFIQKRYGWQPGIPAYIVASYVGWLRVETDDHDSADVIGGAAIGIISSYLLTKAFDDNVRAAAWADGKSAGLQIQVRW